MRRGVTLLEVLVALVLVSLLYALLTFTTVQLGRTSRFGIRAAEAKRLRLTVCERLRWQLRCLFVPPDGLSLKGGRLPGQEDALSFLTSHPAEHRGVVEVSYRILRDGKDGEPYLAYREFPHRDALGLRPWTDQEEAPWKPLDPYVKDFRAEYSRDGQTFQREWDGGDAPRVVRLSLVDRNGEVQVISAFPGVSAARW
ncbi:MAG: prepilin-type N-terminal cleavage/methylation domain-containing protein [Candidatus Eremiobacterota bacterium]